MNTCAAILALALAVPLAGCNAVMADKPVFRAARGAPAERLKDGVWSLEKPCPAGTAAPSCGQPLPLVVVAGDELRPRMTEAPDGGSKLGLRYLLVPGAPMLLQLRMEQTAAGQANHLFGALDEVRRDPDGSIVEALAWPIQCGPPPAPGEPGYGADDDTRYITPHPLPGLVRPPDDEACRPRDAAALRAAAAPSRAWADGEVRLRWVKAGA